MTTTPTTAPGTTTPTLSRTETALRLVDVHKSYPNGPGTVAALRSVSLTIPRGSFTAVMGPSGSGKSTLLHCAAGLDTPTGGSVVVGDFPLAGMSDDELTEFRREHIGFVFQAYNLLDHLTVAENIALPLLLAGRRPDRAWQAQLVEAVGLTGKESRLPGELSGGQAQRVAIARALVTRPTVVFADEPTGALDSHTGAQILDLMRATATSLGQTLVVVTHDAHVAAAADRVVFLRDGLLAGHLEAPSPEQITARLAELRA